MLEITTKMLRDAKAGNYQPSFLGYIKSLLFGGVKLGEVCFLPNEVQLLDISFYQRTASFPTMLSNGIKGVIIRAGQNTWKDTSAEKFMTDAEASEMPVGSYWFYDSRATPLAQAKLWKEVLGNHKTQLWCWADYEEKYGGTYSGWRHFYDFLEACKAEMPDRKFGIYTGYYYWIEHSPNPITQANSLNYFKQYPLWEAWYVSDISFVRIPKPWDKLTLWQQSSNGDGTKYGVGSLSVDMNQFVGTLQEYNSLFNLDNTGGTMPGVNWVGKVKSTVTAGAIVRETPNGADTGQRLSADTPIEGTGELVIAGSYTWMNLVKPAQGWVAVHLLDYSAVSEPAPTDGVVVDVILKNVYAQGDVFAARDVKLVKEA